MTVARIFGTSRYATTDANQCEDACDEQGHARCGEEPETGSDTGHQRHDGGRDEEDGGDDQRVRPRWAGGLRGPVCGESVFGHVCMLARGWSTYLRVTPELEESSWLTA